MRPPSRLLVPALTILCWSLESAYASFHLPGQSLSKRQFRTADYSTSTRPSNSPGSGVKSPETDTSSAPHSGSDASQTSTKTRRSPRYHTKSQLPVSARPIDNRYPHSEDPTYSKAYDGSHSSYGANTYLDTQHSRRRSPLTNAGKQSQSMHIRDAFYKRTTSFTAQHKSGTNDDVTSHSLDNQEKRKPDLVRRSAIDLNTLHIARGLRNSQPQAQAVKPQPQLQTVKSQPQVKTVKPQPQFQTVKSQPQVQAVDPASSPSDISRASGVPSAQLNPESPAPDFSAAINLPNKDNAASPDLPKVTRGV